MHTTRPHTPISPALRRTGFTLVELLVAIAIIALLLGILIVGLFGAQSFAKRAAGTAQLQAIAQGLDAFNTDLGFYPPLISHLNSSTGAIETPETLAAQVAKAGRNGAIATAYREARYMSEWTIAAFLIGEGDLNGDLDADETKLADDDGKLGNGIRTPGESRAWKAPDGDHRPVTTGRDYGPYLDAGFATRFLRRVPVSYNNSAKRIVRDDASRRFMYQLVDAFDVPVRYYRGWRTRDNNDAPTILRLPVELRSADGVEDQLETGFGRAEPERNLLTAPYALLSAGERADRHFEPAASGEPAFAPFGDVVFGLDRVPSAPGTDFLQADGAGVFTGDQSDLDLSVYNLADEASGDPDRVRTLLKFLKSNIRYVP
jgi:prepilin-type N-terminal cleavage/methylation domain-containing protein